jgi:hypothetical protein
VTDPHNLRVYAAFMSLRGNPDFDIVMSYIEVEREKTKEMLVECPLERTQNLQGKARAYGDLIKMSKDAQAVLQRANTPDHAPLKP